MSSLPTVLAGQAKHHPFRSPMGARRATGEETRNAWGQTTNRGCKDTRCANCTYVYPSRRSQRKKSSQKFHQPNIPDPSCWWPILDAQHRRIKEAIAGQHKHRVEVLSLCGIEIQPISCQRAGRLIQRRAIPIGERSQRQDQPSPGQRFNFEWEHDSVPSRPYFAFVPFPWPSPHRRGNCYNTATLRRGLIGSFHRRISHGICSRVRRAH